MLHWARHVRTVRPVRPMPHELVVDIRDELDYAVLRLRGRLSLRSNARAREPIVKSLLSAGRVLVDVSSLRSTKNSYLSVFRRRWPPPAGGPRRGWALSGPAPASIP